MAALMKQQSIMVYTHDSIGQGEDGPTHQAIEQVSSLRSTPNMSVWRPADAVETAVAWKAAIMKTDGPTSLVLSRQGLPHLDRTQQQVNDIAKGHISFAIAKVSLKSLLWRQAQKWRSVCRLFRRPTLMA